MQEFSNKESKSMYAFSLLFATIFLLYAISKKKGFWPCAGFWVMGSIVGSGIGFMASGKENSSTPPRANSAT